MEVRDMPCRRVSSVIGFTMLAWCAAAPALALAANSDWPCIQHKVDTLTSVQMWDGPPIDDLTEWRDDKQIVKLAPLLISRRVPIEKAADAIDAFALARPEDQRDRALTLLFAAVLDATNRDRSIIMAGIEKFQRRQRARADEIERQSAEIRKLRADHGTEPTRIAAAEQEYDWDVRIFNERQQSIPLACEVPVLIEQRLFAIAREIRARMVE